jgi:hypothetical protein
MSEWQRTPWQLTFVAMGAWKKGQILALSRHRAIANEAALEKKAASDI